MNNSIIKAENISKKYSIGRKQNYGSLRESIGEIFSRRQNRSSKEFWALRDINFSINSGEMVGIIGRNGAGKSTLLKILSQITPPTTGKITMRGRVASLLEVGTGFNPELTGRENIFLNGAILGMSQKEIRRKFDEIISFAEINDFLDTPVKRYSSGMYVRLAFAVAAHLEPEILIVDEVLAVGDAVFQKKCLGKMEEVGKEGRTVIFVSHNISAISELCDRVILLKGGKLMKDGPVSDVVGAYLAKDQGNFTSSDLSDPNLRVNSLATSPLKWKSLQLINSSGHMVDHIRFREPISLVASFKVSKLVNEVGLSFTIQSALGYPVFNSHRNKNKILSTFGPGEYTFTIKIDPNLIAPGLYEIGLGANGVSVVDWLPNALQFTISTVGIDPKINWTSNRVGIVDHPVSWLDIKKIK